MVGTTLSHYNIFEELGRGGMGIVYKAEDTKLDRTVAIKVLPSSALASEDDRLRFYREAKAAAQLHHPHIASVFEIDEAVPSDAPHGTQPSPFIAMEYIAGDTLEARIKQGPFKLDEALRIAGEVASALETAHEKNIVHRDIKSGNVMLTAKGTAKVLDFGLAQTAQSTKLTRMGSTLGTIAYMSPEQARSEEVDGRSDLWSLGVVLFEMLVGRLPFAADYEQATIYSILNEDPEPITGLRAGLPMDLEFILGKLLAKDQKHRYQNAAGLIADLSAVQESAPSRISSQSTSRTTRIVTDKSTIAQPRKQFSAIVTYSAVAAALVLGAVLIWTFAKSNSTPPTELEKPVMRLTLNLPEEYPLSFVGGSVLGIEFPALSISSDGKHLVYVSDTDGSVQLVTLDMQTGSFSAIQGTDGAYHPILSPDGDWIAYFSGGELKKVPTSGGRSDLLTSVSDPNGLLWLTNDWIYYVDRQGTLIRRVTPSGELDPDTLATQYRASLLGKSPNSQGLLFSTSPERSIYSYSPQNGVEPFGLFGSHPTYLPSGHHVYTSTGRLVATVIDPQSSTVLSAARTVVDDLRTSSIVGAGQYAFSETGAFVYVPGEPADITRLVIRNEDGSMRRLPFDPDIFGMMDILDDGSKIVVHLTDGSNRLLILDVGRGTSQVLTQDQGSGVPIWSPEGSSVTYSIDDSTGSRIVSKQIDSSIAAELVLSSNLRIGASDWSNDGSRLIYTLTESDHSRILVHDVTNASESEIESSGDTRLWGGTFSPNEDFIAYTRVGTNGSEVLVEPYPLTGERWNISAGIGEEPEWRLDTNEIVFRRSDSWYSISYETEPSFTFSAPRKLFDGPYVNISGMEFRVLADGSILLQEPINTERTADRIEIIVNWFEELKELVPMNNGR